MKIVKYLSFGFLVFLANTYAEDFDVPHTFKAGDVLSAEVLNEQFEALKKGRKAIITSDLVGTWNIEQSVVFGGRVGNAHQPLVGVSSIDDLVDVRSDTVVFSDDGDSTYSFSQTKYDSFAIGNVAQDSPASGSFLVRNGLLITKMGGQIKANQIQKISASRFLLTSLNTGSASFNSVLFDKVKLKPSAPTKLTGSNSELANSLTWADNSSNEEGFLVKRKTTATGSWSIIATLGSDEISYTDSVSTVGSYWYRVLAFNSDGNSTGTKVIKIKITE